MSLIAPVSAGLSARSPRRSNLVLVFLSLVAVLLALAVPRVTAVSAIGLASFVPIVAATILLISGEAGIRPYSLNLMHLMFCFMYLGAVPLAQYLHGYFPLSIDLPRDVDLAAVLKTNVVICLWLGCYCIGYRSKTSRTPSYFAPLNLGVSWLGFVSASLAAAAALVWLFSQGFYGVVTRRGAEIQVSEVSSLALFNDVVVRAVPIMALGALLLACSFVRGRSRGLLLLVALVLGAGVGLIDNPLAAPRYYTGMALIGLAAIVILRRLRTGIAFVPLVSFGILFAMPILNQGRQDVSGEAYYRGVNEPEYIESVIGGDFDAYSGVLRTREYIEEPGRITKGRQLLGVALFWIPRSFWPEKPVGSGTHVALEYGWVSSNVSAALPAEALINFGWLGIPLFAIVFGRILRRLDDLYWGVGSHVKPPAVRVIDVVYPFWLGMVIFLSRGDLLSGFAYTAGITIAALPILIGARHSRPTAVPHARGAVLTRPPLR